MIIASLKCLSKEAMTAMLLCFLWGFSRVAWHHIGSTGSKRTESISCQYGVKFSILLEPLYSIRQYLRILGRFVDRR